MIDMVRSSVRPRAVDASPAVIPSNTVYPHDFVVPTDGVFAANGSGFFPIDDRLVLEGADAAAHTRCFEDARVRGRILEWLTA